MRLYIPGQRFQVREQAIKIRVCIGFLNHLFRWPVPPEFRRGELERIEKGGEAAFHLGKGFIQCKLLAQMRFAFEPYVLGRILFRGIGGKAQAGDFPVGLGQGGILLREKLLQFLPAVITGPIPQEEQFLVWIQGLTPSNIGYRIDPIPCRGFIQMKLLR
jgi:hypothetical protein